MMSLTSIGSKQGDNVPLSCVSIALCQMRLENMGYPGTEHVEAIDGRIQDLMRQILAWLVSRDFKSVEKYSHGIQLSAELIREAVDDYGRKLIMPPDAAFSKLDIIRVSRATVPTRSVCFDLWTEEEGRSDLSLECTVIDRGGKMPEAEIDGIHVL